MPFDWLFLCVFGVISAPQTLADNSETFYGYNVKDINGKTFAFSQLRNKVVLIVNVASQCGYTDSNYKGLKMMHDALYKEGFFQIVAFPCNQFGKQEPGSAEEIKQVAYGNYGVNFPLMAKTDVIGGDAAHPVYQFLREQAQREPNWNFWKYLVSHEGKVLKAYPQNYTPDMIFDDLVRFYCLVQIKDEGGLPARCILPPHESRKILQFLESQRDVVLWSTCSKAFALSVQNENCANYAKFTSFGDGKVPILVKNIAVRGVKGNCFVARFNFDASCAALATPSGNVHIWRLSHPPNSSLLSVRNSTKISSHSTTICENFDGLCSKSELKNSNSLGALSFVPPKLVQGRKSVFLHKFVNCVRLSSFDNFTTHSIKHYNPINDNILRIECAPGPSANFSVSCQNSSTIRVCNLELCQPVRLLTTGDLGGHFVVNLAWHPNETTIAAACENDSICLLDTRSGRISNFLTPPSNHSKLASGQTRKLLFEPCGKSLMQFSMCGQMKLWDLSAGKLLHCNSTASEGTSFGDAIFLPQNGTSARSGTILLASTTGSIRLWNWDGALHNYIPSLGRHHNVLAPDLENCEDVIKNYSDCVIGYNEISNSLFTMSILSDG